MQRLIAAAVLLVYTLVGAPAQAQTQQTVRVGDSVSTELTRGGADNLTLHGRVFYVLRGADGRVKEERVGPNLVVNAGMAGIASRINGSGGEAAFAWIGVGIGTNAAAAGDTTLQTERDEAGASNTNHKACATSRITTDVANDTAQCVATFNFTTTLAITESGYFNATPSGTMLSRQTFSAINVVNGDSLQVTWKIDVD